MPTSRDSVPMICAVKVWYACEKLGRRLMLHQFLDASHQSIEGPCERTAENPLPF